MKVQVSNANTPVWRDITVESRMPAQLNILQEMARNIWWVCEQRGPFHVQIDRS